MRESTSGAERRDLISASQILNCEGDTGGVYICIDAFRYSEFRTKRRDFKVLCSY